jgi:hypothetical protein
MVPQIRRFAEALVGRRLILSALALCAGLTTLAPVAHAGDGRWTSRYREVRTCDSRGEYRHERRESRRDHRRDRRWDHGQRSRGECRPRPVCPPPPPRCEPRPRCDDRPRSGVTIVIGGTRLRCN